MKESRRYPNGKYPDYDNYLNRKMSNSLENGGGEYYDGQHIDLNIKEDLNQLRNVYTDKIKFLLEEVNQAKINRKERKQQSINQGKRFNDTITRDELELQANYDFLIIERVWIDSQLLEVKKKDDSQDDQIRINKMRRSPLGTVESINYETGRGHISYMKVEPVNGNGIVCIIDKLSPFSGMSVLDFREFIIPLHKLEVNKIYAERMKAWNEKGKEGFPPSIRKINPKWPDWPKGIQNHLEKTK